MLISGQKSVETRKYPLPKKYLNQWLAVIETQNTERRDTRVVGLVRFEKCFRYETAEKWARDVAKHRVKKGDPNFAYREGEPKWGWKVSGYLKLDEALAPPETRGIVYARACPIPSKIAKTLSNVL